MNASATENASGMAVKATAVISMMLRSFDEAPVDVQGEVASYCNRLHGLLEAEPDMDRERGLVSQIESLLAADEWSATTENCNRHRKLFAIAMELRKLKGGREAVDVALTRDLTRVPLQGWTVEVVRRSSDLAKLAPSAAVAALLEVLPAINWDEPAEASALARTRAELVPSQNRGRGSCPLSNVDAKGAYDNQERSDAAHAVALWLKAGPTATSVKPIITAKSMQSTLVQSALEKWAAKQSEETRTSMASALIGLRVKRHLTFAALSEAGVNEVALVNTAGRVIRGLGKVDERISVAETVAGHRYGDEAARTAVIRLIVHLLLPRKPKGNIDVVLALLPTLQPGPLDNPDALNQAIRRAQKRHGLKFTAEQGEQLITLGVTPHKDWFGKRVSDQLKRFF
jgi:hypothetical protein